MFFFFFSSRRRHTRFDCDWSSDVCSSDLVPHRLLGGEFAVAVLFDWDERARGIVAEGVETAGLTLVDWRPVPVDADSLGERARETMPNVWHGLVARPDIDGNEWEHRLYLARRRIERRAAEDAVRMYLPSLSSRTVVYKGLMAGTRLAD